MSPVSQAMHTNPLVEFLRTYGPTAAADSIWDEHVVAGASANGVSALDVPSDRLDGLEANFRSDDPVSVILTGTAGDGKTWHCRQVFVRLGGDHAAWERSGPLIDLPLGRRRLVVIKDLSQFQDDPRLPEIMGRILPVILGRSSAEVFLMAANDGQLLRFWRSFADTNPEAGRIEERLRVMLKEDRSTDPSLTVHLHNLSRQPHDRLFEQVAAVLGKHEDWRRCEGCALLESDRCPIRRNLAILCGNGASSMRDRLRDLIRLAADNDNHLPMRHVLLLAVNVILGVSGRATSLMRCSTAHALAEEDRLDASNPYDNALGLNLADGVNRQYRAFTVFEGMGIGRETNNAIDALLVDAVPEREHDALMRSDPVFGNGHFERIRSQYQRGILEDFQVFRSGIEAQRRRLFFIMPSRTCDDSLDPWKLTVFTYGGEYLRFAADLAGGRSIDWIRPRLVIGLNRSYVGAMCDESQQVWLASPAANTQSRIGRVLDAEVPVGRTLRFTYHFDFDAGGPHGRVRMVVRSSAGLLIGTNDLPPLLFEYLMRVQAGSLPGSFSRQCFEELRHFRLQVVGSLARLGLIELDSLNEMRIIRPGLDGTLRQELIEVAGGFRS